MVIRNERTAHVERAAFETEKKNNPRNHRPGFTQHEYTVTRAPFDQPPRNPRTTGAGCEKSCEWPNLSSRAGWSDFEITHLVPVCKTFPFPLQSVTFIGRLERSRSRGRGKSGGGGGWGIGSVRSSGNRISLGSRRAGSSQALA